MIGLGFPRIEPTLAQTDGNAQAPSPATPAPQPARGNPRATLEDPNASPDDRRAAASELLASNDPATRAMLHREVVDDNPKGVRRAIAEAVAALDTPPAFIEPALASCTDKATPEELVWLLPALRGFQSHATVASVVSLLRRVPPLPDATLGDVFTTLTAQTGQTLPRRPGPWLEWWMAHENDPPADWYRAIAAAQARRARVDAQDRDRLASDVERLYREVHALTPVGERSPMIADLIRSDRRLLASIGFDLARRALLNARPLGPEVVDAAAARLSDHDVTVRRDAANLLDRIDPPDIGPRAAEALRTETDPETAAALLRIISRQPEAGANQATVHWAQTPGPARAPALSAGVALHAKGYLTDPASVAEIQRVALAEIDAGNPTVAGVRFLAATGHVDRLVGLLESDNREVALVAADAIAASPELYPRLIVAARTHPDLYASAATAIRANLPTAKGLRALLSLPAPSDDDRLRAAALVATALQPADLLDVAGEMKDPALLSACLSHVATIEFMSRPDDAPARRRLLLLLLQTRLAQHNPEGVLQALSAIQDQVDTSPYASQRVAALLRLGRIDDAEKAPGAADVSASVWLDALADSVTQPFAATLAERIRSRFKDRLTDEQAHRLDQLVATIATPPPDPGSSPDAALDSPPSPSTQP